MRIWRSSRSWLGLLISTLALFWVWSVIASAPTRYAFRDVALPWLVPAPLLYGAATWMRAWRWTWVIDRSRLLGARQLFPLVAIGYAGNNLLPARAGEILRVALLNSRYGIDLASGGIGIILERVSDSIVLLAALSAALVVLPPTVRLSLGPVVASVAALFGMVLLGIVVVVCLAPSLAAVVNRWAINGPTSARRLHLAAGLSRILAVFTMLRDVRTVAALILLTILAWTFEYTIYVTVAAAFRLETQSTTLLLMMGVVSLVAAIPSAPGYVGTFHAAGIYSLSLLGVAAGPAAAYTVVVHAVLWAPITLFGALLWPRFGLSWQSLRSSPDASPGDVQ